MYSYLQRHVFFLAALTVVAFAAGTSSLQGGLIRVSPYLTRGEAAAIVMLASPAPLPTIPATIPYIDVRANDWFAPSLLGAARIGALSPDATGTKLRPFGAVSRATFLKLLSVGFGLPPFQPHSFTDVQKAAWYAPYVGTEQTYRLFTHADPTKLEPDRLVTQDEARDALQVFLSLRSKAEEEQAKRTAVAQAAGDVQLYTVISTKKLRVVFVSNAQPTRTTQTPVIAAMSPARAQSIDAVRAEVLSLVNAARSKAGLPALKRSAALERSAQAYADEMNTLGFFGHVDPDGHTLKDRVDAVGYYDASLSDDCHCVKGYSLAENIARGQRSAKDVVEAWMNSPSHREAILGSDFTDLGVGIQSGIWVQHFGGLLVPETR